VLIVILFKKKKQLVSSGFNLCSAHVQCMLPTVSLRKIACLTLDTLYH